MAPGYTRLHGTAIGPGASVVLASVEAGTTGTVVQVFDRTVYLELGDEVLILGTAAVRDGPLMVRTDAGPGLSFSDHLSPDDACQVLGEDPVTLSIGSSLVLQISDDCKTVQEDTGGREALDIEIGDPVWSNARWILEAAIQSTEDGLGLLTGLKDAVDQDRIVGEGGERVQDIAAAMQQALVDGPGRTDLSPLEWLVGRGPGATPSGDDVLSGMAVVLARTTTGTVQDRVQETIGTLLDDGPQTTRMSAALLEQAAQGRAPEPVVTCQDSLLDVESDPEQVVVTMETIGHHSGPDALAGMLTAVLLIGPRLP